MEMAKVGLQLLKPATKTTLKRVSAIFCQQRNGDSSIRKVLYYNILAHSMSELMQSRGVRHPSVCLSVCPSVRLKTFTRKSLLLPQT